MSDDERSRPWGNGPSLGDIAAARLDKGRAFLQARNADAAIREAEAVFSQDPNGRFGFQALDLIGDAHVEKGDFASVTKIGRELLSIDPERLEGYIHLARGALEQDDMRVCIEGLERGLERNPNALSLIILNSVRFRRCDDTKRALEWAEKAVAMAPWHPGALNTLGFALAQAGRKAEAQRAFDEARALDPMSGYTVSTAAIVAFSENRFDEAHDLALQALALDPQDDDARRIAYRSRWFGNVLMRPFWFVHAMTKAHAAILAAAVIALLVVLTPLALGRFVLPTLAIYYLSCLFIVLLVQALNDPKRPKKPPNLKNY